MALFEFRAIYLTEEIESFHDLVGLSLFTLAVVHAIQEETMTLLQQSGFPTNIIFLSHFVPKRRQISVLVFAISPIGQALMAS